MEMHNRIYAVRLSQCTMMRKISAECADIISGIPYGERTERHHPVKFVPAVEFSSAMGIPASRIASIFESTGSKMKNASGLVPS